MSREINISEPLSDDDISYLRQRPWLITEIELETGLSFDEVVEQGAGYEEVEEVVDLESLKKAELIELCQERDLETTGTKDDLIARLVEFESEAADTGEDNQD